MNFEKRVIAAYIMLSILCPVIMSIYYLFNVIPQIIPIIAQSISAVFYIIFILLSKNEIKQIQFFWTIISVIFPYINLAINPCAVMLNSGSMTNLIKYKFVPFITLTLFPLILLIFGYSLLIKRLKKNIIKKANNICLKALT